jgi:hypothetical protein
LCIEELLLPLRHQLLDHLLCALSFELGELLADLLVAKLQARLYDHLLFIAVSLFFC